MDLKNLMSHAVRPVNPTTRGELPAPELAQLSEEDLQQIIGGGSVEVGGVLIRWISRQPIITKRDYLRSLKIDIIDDAE